MGRAESFQGQGLSVCGICCDHCVAPERPHQAKQFHVRFIEREEGKVAAEREGGKREKQRDQRGRSLYMDGDIVTGKDKGGR